MQRTRLEQALDAAGRVARGMTVAAGGAVLAAAVLIAAEVFMRATLNRAIDGLDEICGYVLAVGSAWSFAYALLVRAHVRIDTVYLALPRALRPWLDLLALIALAFFAIALCYRAGELFALSYSFASRSMSPLQVPLWIPQGFWLFGLMFFAFVIVLLAARLVALLASGRHQLATGVAGLESIEEEVQEEIADAQRRRASA